MREVVAFRVVAKRFGSQSGVFFEILTEEGGVGKVQFVGDLLDAEVWIFDQVLGLTDNEAVDPCKRREVGFLLGNGR